MHHKSITNIYEALLVFIFISGLIIYSTNFENENSIESYKIVQENKIKDVCNSLYEFGIFHNANASFIRKQAKKYLNEFEIKVSIINITDNSIISSSNGCQNEKDKYAISYLIGWQYENATIHSPKKIIILVC